MSMALDANTITVLLQQLELDRQAYLNSHNKLQQALLQILPTQPNQAEVSAATGTSTPSIDATLAAPEITLPRRPTSFSSKRTVPQSLFEGNKAVTSLYSAENSDDSDEDESFFAQRPLEEQSISEDDLKQHIKTHPWNDHERLILGDVRKTAKIKNRSLFQHDPRKTDAGHNHADIYEVDEHGAPMRTKVGESEDGDKSTWEALRQVNKDRSKKQAVGRIVIMREPSALLFGALHLALMPHFDMDYIYRVLIDDEHRTRAYVDGHQSDDHRRQRSILFVFKYHTIVGSDRKPLPWQNHDDDISSKPDHIPISTCSSVVALSLSGKPMRSFRRHSRKSKSPETSQIYDPFAPYNVLSLQCFPDWHSEVNLHETHHHYVNGPDALLATLLHEHRDATKRFKLLVRRISELVTPDKRVIFLAKMRDDLLFENEAFTYSRRYFWASQTLGLVIDEIEAIIASYKDTFTDDVWSGEHKTLFPGPASTSARYQNWRKKMSNSRKLFEKEMSELKDVLRTCLREQKDIEKLREWLFAGTSVQESRKAVEQTAITVNQGYNVKLLTLVNIFFLPLTFCTSIFGMTNMDPNEGFVHFGIVTAAICIPTYFMIVVINRPDEWDRAVYWVFWPFIIMRSGFKFSSDRAKRYKDKYLTAKDDEDGKQDVLPGISRANTMASLDWRLSKEGGRDRLQSVAGLEDVVTIRKTGADAGGQKPIANTNGDLDRPALPERESTIRFDIPEYKPKSSEDDDAPEPSPMSSSMQVDRSLTAPITNSGNGMLAVPIPGRLERRHTRSNSAPTSRNLFRRLSRAGSTAEDERSPV